MTDPVSFVERELQPRPPEKRAEADQNCYLWVFAPADQRPSMAIFDPAKRFSIGPNLFAIERFVEKPDAETAARYVAEDYLWNSGNFMFAARCLIDEYKRFEPESAATILRSVEAAGKDLGFYTPSECVNPLRGGKLAKSIDLFGDGDAPRALAAVMPGFIREWSDVGSWQAVWGIVGPR